MFLLRPDRNHLGWKRVDKELSQFPGSPCWVCKYKKLNGKLKHKIIRVHGRNRSQPGMCPLTTCSGAWLMGHCLEDSVRHPEAAGKLMGEGLSAGTGRHLSVHLFKGSQGTTTCARKCHNAHPSSSHTHRSTWGF